MTLCNNSNRKPLLENKMLIFIAHIALLIESDACKSQEFGICGLCLARFLCTTHIVAVMLLASCITKMHYMRVLYFPCLSN